MNRHQSSGRLALGLGLASVTALIWGTLPVVLKLLVNWVDVYTLAWFRFIGALLVVIGSSLGALSRSKPKPRKALTSDAISQPAD